MEEKLKKFFSILLVELDDMSDGFTMLIDATEERFKKHEITGYVWTENTALLKSERTLIELIRSRIAKMDPFRFSSLEEAKTAVLDAVKEQHSVPQAVPAFIEKRIDKVISYVQE